MVMSHAHRRLLKCSRWLLRCIRLGGVALGCGIGPHVVAWAAPPLGTAATAVDGAPVSVSTPIPAASNVGCGPKGVALQVLGSGGPELQDKRASSSYLIWRAGVPRLLVAHNAVPEGASGVERSLHMPPSIIGKIASAASVKQLVLAHRMLRTLGRETESEGGDSRVLLGPGDVC